MLGAISQGTTVVNGLLHSEDCLNTFRSLKQMGIEFTQSSKDTLEIKGKGLYGLKRSSEFIYAGNSGTTMRLLSGILAGQEFDSEITGDESLSKRPMNRITNPLQEMGAEISARENKYPPLKIKGGQLKPINYTLPIPSAQVKSCLLLAGLYARGTTTIVEPVKSRDHTERMLQFLGADINLSQNRIDIRGPGILYAKDITVPGDISSASFFIVAALLLKNSSLTIKNVGINPTRTGIIEVLRSMGASIKYTNIREMNNEPVSDIVVSSSTLNATLISGELIPRLIDEIPVIAVAASQAKGTTTISGARELRVKETDRIKAITSELSRMGADIKEFDDGFSITGPSTLRASKVNSSGDHRMAMSLAIAGLIAKGETDIFNTECINTSFPEFFNVINQISC